MLVTALIRTPLRKTESSHNTSQIHEVYRNFFSTTFYLYYLHSAQSATTKKSTCKCDSHYWQFRSFQHCTTELLDVTVVNIVEVVSSLQGERKKMRSTGASGNSEVCSR